MAKPPIKIVTQNIFLSKRLKKLVQFINDHRADIYCLQEIRSVKVADKIKDQTGYPYLLSGQINAVYRFKFHNLILTNLTILESGELNFTKKKCVRGSNHAGTAFWVTLKKNDLSFRIYNCHLTLAGIHPQERLKLLEKIIKHSQNYQGPVIICGDMNTALPDQPRNMRVIKWFNRIPISKEEFTRFLRQRKSEAWTFYTLAKKYGFEEAAELHKNTWVFPFTGWGMFGLKLDWMLYKGFVKNNHLLAKPIGDHKAIIGEFSVN